MTKILSALRRVLPTTLAAVCAGAVVAFAAAGPANYPDIFGGGFHGTPEAKMGCDASGNCVPGMVPYDVFGNAVEQRKTYRYSVTAITPVATPTDIVRICGSSTLTVKVKRIYVGGYATTGGQFPIELLRETGAGTIGSATLTAVTAAQHDVNDAAPTATVNYVQTANYGTVPTLVAQLGVMRTYLNVAATGPTTPASWDYSIRQDKPLFLRGTSDCISLNGVGTAVPTGGRLDFEIETEEDNS